jgi:hypothetical protein
MAMSRAFSRSVTLLVNSPIVAGLVGASFGLVLSNLSNDQKPGPPRWALMGIFLAAIMSSVFVYNRLASIGKKVDSLQDTTDLVRLDRQSGGMDIVFGLVENAKVIRVVGRARQDQLDEPRSSQRNYLKATESSVKSGQTRVYRRITGDVLRPTFRDHLMRVFEASKPGQIIEVATVDDIDAMISYQVFDSTAAIVGIETSPVPGVRDSTIVFLTYQADIIEALVAHFDSAWVTLKPHSKVEDFRASSSAIVS